MHFTPAGLPFGIPGISEEIERAIQHAAQFSRQSIIKDKRQKYKDKSIETKVQKNVNVRYEV